MALAVISLIKKLCSVEVKSTCGYAIKLEWLCEAMHRGSSSIYTAGMSVNYIVETLLSGMSHHQFMRFCRFTHTSPISYARNQRLYTVPAIHQEYLRMWDSIIDDVSKAKILFFVETDGWILLDFVLPRQRTHLWRKGVVNL